MANLKTKYIIDADFKQLNQELSKTGKRINETTGKLEDVGKKSESAFKGKLLAGVGIATAALATFFTKVNDWVNDASELEEATSKFNVVFRDVGKEAENVKKQLTDAYGLSRIESTKLLAATGDLLTGFGFQGKAALDVSEKVNKLAVDLASFSNAEGGAEAVSNALTKALLGERESLKTYGIAIREADVQQKLLEKGQKGLTGQALNQAKAYATLELSLEQSKNAIGDFARTSDSFANIQRTTNSEIQDFGSNVGKYFLPAAKEAYSSTKDLVSGLNDILETKVSEKLEEEKISVNNLVTSITSLNEDNEIRKRLLRQLKQQYPDFLKNLDTEKSSNNELTIALDNYNKKMLERIKYQLIQEDLEKNLRKQRELRKKEESSILQVNKIFNEQLEKNTELQNEYLIALDDTGQSTLNYKQKAELLSKFLTESLAKESKGRNDVGILYDENYKSQLKLSESSKLLSDSTNSLNKLEKEKIELEKESKELAESLNTTTIKQTKDSDDSTDSIIKNTDAIIENNEILNRRIQLNKELAKINQDSINDLNDSYEQEKNELESLEDYKYRTNRLGSDRYIQILENRAEIEKAINGESEAYLRLQDSITRVQQSQANQTMQTINDGIAVANSFLEIAKAGGENQKEIAITQAVINTALAITKTLAQTGVLSPLAIPAIVAQGAAQIAAIQSQSFAIGKEDFKGGFAKVHKDEITYMPPGTDVYSKREVKQTFEKNNNDAKETNKLLRQLIAIEANRSLKLTNGAIVEAYDKGKKYKLRKN